MVFNSLFTILLPYKLFSDTPIYLGKFHSITRRQVMMKTTVTLQAQNGIYSDLFSGFALTYCYSKQRAQKQAIITLLHL